MITINPQISKFRKFVQKSYRILKLRAFYPYLVLEVVNEVNRIRRTNHYVKAKNLNKFSLSKLREKKKSKTLFILGSGASINELRNSDWQMIRENDSVGFNLWPIHNFVPTFYMFEPSKYPDRVKLVHELLSLKVDEYRDVPMIGVYFGDERTNRHLDGFPKELKENTYMSYALIPGKEKHTFEKGLKLINESGLYKANLLFSKRATVARAVLFGFQMGYKDIVLCGVDLNNTKYFYEDEKYKNLPISIPQKHQKGNVHNTLDKTYGELTIDIVIQEINKSLLQPNNVNLYIGSRNSALYPMLPFYFISSSEIIA